jgi:hypothetical protein
MCGVRLYCITPATLLLLLLLLLQGLQQPS